METVNPEEMETYALRLQNIITQYIATRTILDIFLVTERQMGQQVKQRWQKKEGIYLDLEGVRVAARAAEDFMESGAVTEAEEQRGDE